MKKRHIPSSIPLLIASVAGFVLTLTAHILFIAEVNVSPLHLISLIGMFILMYKTISYDNKYNPDTKNPEAWKETLNGSKFLKVIAFASVAYMFLNFFWAPKTRPVPETPGGQYVVNERGKDYRMTEKQYNEYLCRMPRLCTGHLLVFYALLMMLNRPKE